MAEGSGGCVGQVAFLFIVSHEECLLQLPSFGSFSPKFKNSGGSQSTGAINPFVVFPAPAASLTVLPPPQPHKFGLSLEGWCLFGAERGIHRISLEPP